MLPPSLENIIGEDAVRQWERLVASLPVGPLYHGTSLARAERIVAEGFRASFGRVDDRRPAETYWGRPAAAAGFAVSRAIADRCQPAIIQASLDAVLCSGEAMPLREDCDNVDTAWPSWVECHAETGALWVRGGRHVEGMALITPVPMRSNTVASF